MNELAFSLTNVRKSYKHFQLRDFNLELPQGCIMGFVGPNGAGKSTTIRILMGLIRHDDGEVVVLGRPMPARQSEIKRDIGFVSEDMRLYAKATIGWHLQWLKSIYPAWDSEYAARLLARFKLKAEQRVKGLSHGQSVKVALLLSLARHPRLLILDEPTTGLDPVVRHELLRELVEVLREEDRSVLMSSHNTQDVEQIADIITFVNDGVVLETADKKSFLDRWRRVLFDAEPENKITLPTGHFSMTRNGRTGVLITGEYDDETTSWLGNAGVSVRDVQRLTLEEIFLARIAMGESEGVLGGRRA